ncbi:MAG: hypothetical protein KAH35_05910 [Candidatus Atribacteria bacterium]|nr:hypothetical protein [Candidatus Atribacteria bacterium]
MFNSPKKLNKRKSNGSASLCINCGICLEKYPQKASKDFLKESYQISKLEEIKETYEMFVYITRPWGVVSKLFIKAGNTKDTKYINKASVILVKMSNKEKKAISFLLNTCQE